MLTDPARYISNFQQRCLLSSFWFFYFLQFINGCSILAESSDFLNDLSSQNKVLIVPLFYYFFKSITRNI